LQAIFLFLDCTVAAALTWLPNWLALRSYRQLRREHWTQRARQLWPARTAAAVLPWLLPADILLFQRLLGPDKIPPWPLAALVAWLGVIVASYPFDREIFPWLTSRAWRHQVMAGWTLRFAIWFLFFGTIAVMPRAFDGETCALGTGFVIAFIIWLSGGLVWSLHKLRLISPAPERLKSIVDSLSERMRVPVRRVWLLQSSASSAFALPYTRELLFSERLLKVHPDEEVAAICGHELGHLTESKLMRAGRLTGFLFYLPWLYVKPAAYTWGPAGVVGLGLVSWLGYKCSRALSRRLEKRADAVAQANEADSGIYARALARLHEENLVPAVMPRRRTHPDLYDRLLATGVQPDYPRPIKPSANAPHVMILSMLLGVLLVANFLQKAPLKSGPEQTESIPQNDGAKRGGKFDLLSAPE
jgi:Zn-dependent protease with chaperone function